MHDGSFFYNAFIYLSAAVLAVPVAKKLGLGSVLGYLFAGILIGPYVFSLVGESGQDVMHFAEFGVVMMLFLIGLELQPSLLWKLRTPILGFGGVQVVVTAAIITALTIVFTPLHLKSAIAIGLSLALSSTAIVLQTLHEKGLMKSKGGQNAFSVLLFQDIAVIPILAIMPLLAVYDTSAIGAVVNHNWIEGLPILWQTGIVVGGVAAIILSGKYLVEPLFRMIAATHLRELFTAAALLLVISITLLMTKVGLSPALGTFVAGVILARSEYRHELESDIEPFKGLLLGLFFIAVGSSIDFELIVNQYRLITVLVVSLIAVKMLVLFVIGKIFGMRLNNNLLFTFSLAQGGEFAFVLLSFALQSGVIKHNVMDPLIASVAITMALTPLLMLVNERIIQPRVNHAEIPSDENDIIDEQNKIIIAGFGRFGSTIGRFLRACGQDATYLDVDPDNVALLRKMGFKVFYGDAGRNELLHAAGAENASLLIVAVDNPEKSAEIVENAKKYFPNLKVFVRTYSWNESYEMMDLGIDDVYREYYDSALRMAADSLTFLGHRKYTTYRTLNKFRKHEEVFMRELAEIRHEKNAHILGRKERIEDLEQLIRDDIEHDADNKDVGWDKTSQMEELSPLIKRLKRETKPYDC